MYQIISKYISQINSDYSKYCIFIIYYIYINTLVGQEKYIAYFDRTYKILEKKGKYRNNLYVALMCNSNRIC